MTDPCKQTQLVQFPYMCQIFAHFWTPPTLTPADGERVSSPGCHQKQATRGNFEQWDRQSLIHTAAQPNLPPNHHLSGKSPPLQYWPVQRTLVRPPGHGWESGWGSGGGNYKTVAAPFEFGRMRLMGWSVTDSPCCWVGSTSLHSSAGLPSPTFGCVMGAGRGCTCRGGQKI